MKVGLLLIGFVLGSIQFAEAQQPATIPRIGYISGAGNLSNQGPYVEALRQGLRDLGYIEERNIAIEHRGSEGKTGRYPTLVNELVQSGRHVLENSWFVANSTTPHRYGSRNKLSTEQERSEFIVGLVVIRRELRANDELSAFCPRTCAYTAPNAP